MGSAEDDRARFAEYRRTHDGRLREDIVRDHLGLAEALARRFQGRTVPLEDLLQVAAVGLVKAVDRYDPDRGHPFEAFAVPTMLGELRRHFRDAAWSVHVPRRLQELAYAVREAAADLAQELGRSPSVPELAGRLGNSADEILDAIDASRAYRTASLDDAGRDESGTQTWTLGDQIVEEDEPLESTERRSVLKSLFDALPDRERRIVFLRYYEELTQAEIAGVVGLSQMHVSRLLARSLRALRLQAS